MPIQPECPAPRYQQIRAALSLQIKNGELPPHAKIPSERQLCEQYGVSRLTIRQALSQLKEEGVIYARHGKGIFVADPRFTIELGLVLNDYNETSTPASDDISVSIIDARLVPATPAIMQALRLDAPTEIVQVERLRLVKKTPIALQLMYMPHYLCPGFLDLDLASKSPMELLLRDTYHVELDHMDQIVRAGMSNSREMEFLNLKRPCPVLILERRVVIAGGAILQFARSAYPAGMFQLLLTLGVARGTFSYLNRRLVKEEMAL